MVNRVTAVAKQRPALVCQSLVCVGCAALALDEHAAPYPQSLVRVGLVLALVVQTSAEALGSVALGLAALASAVPG